MPETKGFIAYTLNGQLNFVDYIFLVDIALGSILLIRGSIPKWIFLVLCLFWRLIYNLGLGVILRRQSENEWFTAQVCI